MPISETRLMDCMEYMKDIPDVWFELAVVDPPYGIGDRLINGGGKLKNTPMAVLYRNSIRWDTTPEHKYWNELFRVSKNQMVFGANYFIEYLTNSRCFICWDKKQHMPTLSACELIWTSFDKPAKIARFSSRDLNRFHPTQKPVSLYKWILNNYAKPGDKILDTHMGSQSSRIACWDGGFDFYGTELDKDYFDAGEKRFQDHIKQLTLNF